jgi:hypothetical protein
MLFLHTLCPLDGAAGVYTIELVHSLWHSSSNQLLSQNANNEKENDASSRFIPRGLA